MLQKALELKIEHEKEYMFYNAHQRAGFYRRLQAMAAKIEVTTESNYPIVLTLDVISIRLNTRLRYKGE